LSKELADTWYYYVVFASLAATRESWPLLLFVPLGVFVAWWRTRRPESD
jgi:hypothetical protein